MLTVSTIQKAAVSFRFLCDGWKNALKILAEVIELAAMCVHVTSVSVLTRPFLNGVFKIKQLGLRPWWRRGNTYILLWRPKFYVQTTTPSLCLHPSQEGFSFLGCPFDLLHRSCTWKRLGQENDDNERNYFGLEIKVRRKKNSIEDCRICSEYVDMYKPLGFKTHPPY